MRSALYRSCVYELLTKMETATDNVFDNQQGYGNAYLRKYRQYYFLENYPK